MPIPESDPYPQTQVTTPAGNAKAVTPSDSVDLADLPRELYVGVTGTVVLEMAANGETVTLLAVAAGSRLPYVARKVLATGTTATDIVAFW